MKGEWKRKGKQGEENQVYAPRQLHHRHTTKMNVCKIQAEADSDSSIVHFLIGNFGETKAQTRQQRAAARLVVG